jgi:carbon-monoxide dehydrogenase medium subunit
MKPFEFHQPTKLGQACALKAEYGNQARLIAGGTDLLVKMKKGLIAPGHLIDLKGIDDLDFIHEQERAICIGALTTLAAISAHPRVAALLPLIKEAAESIGSVQVRNLATIGGNLCNAAPSADMAPALLVLDAEICVQGAAGSRVLPLKEFFTGPGEMDLAPDEVLTEIVVPLPERPLKSAYLKHGPRRAMDVAVVGVAVAIGLDQSQTRVEQARIALGAVAPIPMRAPAAEKLLENKPVNDLPLEEAGRAVAATAKPISDVRASAEYRLEMVEVLGMRAVASALGRA